MNGTLFSDNTATGDGGAIYEFTALGDQITDSTFQGNTAADSGGAYWDWSAGGDTIGSSTFSGNTAATGGALYLDTTGSFLTGVVVQGNSATGDGGGIADGFPDSYASAIVDSKITGNHAGGAGGALDEEGTAPGRPRKYPTRSSRATARPKAAASVSKGATITLFRSPTALFLEIMPVASAAAFTTRKTSKRRVPRLPATGPSPTRSRPDNCEPPGSITGCTGCTG